jgi:hypothetical protein
MSAGLVSLGSLAGGKEHARIASFIATGTKDRSPAEIECSNCLQGLRHSWSPRELAPYVSKGRGGVGILIIRLVILHSDRSSVLTLFSVLLHRSFLHSLKWLVTHICRRWASALKAGSLVFSTASLTVSLCVFNFEHGPVMEAMGQNVSDTGEWNLIRFRDIAWQFFDTRRTHLIREVRVGR